MADVLLTNASNALGKFFVDTTCIDCDACRNNAPNHFTRDTNTGLSYVYKQPQSQEEEETCMDAVEGCPVDAIGIQQ